MGLSIRVKYKYGCTDLGRRSTHVVGSAGGASGNVPEWRRTRFKTTGRDWRRLLEDGLSQ